jgi:prepilin-type processing-associated H-X9-DG protein
MSSQSDHPGLFTRLELFLVLGGLLLLVALVIPAAMVVRERARGSQCKNNLKQLGLALHNYLDAHRAFPPGYVAATDDPAAAPATLDGPSGFAWGTMILPYIEASPLYNYFRFEKPCWVEPNSRHIVAPYSTYLCPSAFDESHVVVTGIGPSVVSVPFGRSHYVGNAGQEPPWKLSPPQADWSQVANGILFRNSRVRIEEITDGTSNTVMLGEHTYPADKVWAGIIPGSVSCPTRAEAVGVFCDPAATIVLFSSGSARTGIRTPNARPGPVDQLSSMHAGGCHVLLCDGSVPFLSDRIDPSVWAASCSRDGGDNPDWEGLPPRALAP